jgi:hypothetical protein
MSRIEDKLEQLADGLKSAGDDALRLEVVQRARRFKRSWVEMAEALVHVQDSRAFERWGYSDLHEYCAKELRIRSQTVEKLTGSYSALRAHAPEVLARDGVARTIPTIDAVDYFARALERRGGADEIEPSSELVDDLHKAVFDEALPVETIKRKFDPLFHPHKPVTPSDLDILERTRATGRRLGLLVEECKGLSSGTRQMMEEGLAELETELSAKIESKRKKLETA